MRTIIKKDLIGKLRESNISENFIDKLIQKLINSKKKFEIEKLQKKLADLTTDSEYQGILKKYNIKAMDWSKNYDR